MSSWVRSTTTAATIFNQQDVEDFVDSVDKGAGPRHCSYTNAIICYLGPRQTVALRASPFNFTSPSMYHHDYTRQEQNESHVERARLAAKVNLAMDMALQISKRCNPEHTAVFGYDICLRGLLTGAASARRKKVNDKHKLVPHTGTHQTLGFVNEVHRDRLDKITNKEDIDFFFSQEKVNRNSIDYVKLVHETVGIGMTTTCGHNLIGVINSSQTLLAHFAEMDFAVPIKNRSFHSFYGHSFPHATVLPIMLYSKCHDNDNKKYVRVSNLDWNDNPFCVFAWGANGGSKEARLRREQREANEQSEDLLQD